MRQMQGKEQGVEITQSICELAMVVGTFQNELQAIHEMITLRQDFNPQKLYHYLCYGEQELTRTQLLWFTEDNELSITEEQIKIFFSIYGYKDKLSYYEFLNYIYPFDIDTLKIISTTNSKKYVKMDDETLSEEIKCCFILLLQKEIEFLHNFQERKTCLIPNFTRDYLKKTIKQVKKCLPLSFQQGVQSDYVLTFKEFKAILKKIKNIPERRSQSICRRLSLQKDSFIGIDQFQIWFKPWSRLKAEESPSIFPHQTLLEDIQSTIKMEVS